MELIQKSKTDLIRFKYFLSSVSNEYIEQYYHGQQSALKKHNILGIKAPHHFETTESIIICAHDSIDDAMVGGIRIEIKSDKHPLPIEKSQLRHVETFSFRVDQLKSQGLSIIEICGLWAHNENRPHLKTVSLGGQLCFQAVQLCLDLGFQVLTAIVPPHTLIHMEKLGFVTDELIHQIPYPDDRYLSSVIWYFNPQQKINYSLLSKLNNKEVVEYGS